MRILNLATIILIITIGYAFAKKHFRFVQYSNATAELNDRILFETFRNRLHDMVKSVPWNTHFKAWVETGLIAGQKPLSHLLSVANEVGNHTEYSEWEKELFLRMKNRVQLAVGKAANRYASFIKDQLKQSFANFQKKRSKGYTEPVAPVYEERTEDYSYSIAE